MIAAVDETGGGSDVQRGDSCLNCGRRPPLPKVQICKYCLRNCNRKDKKDVEKEATKSAYREWLASGATPSLPGTASKLDVMADRAGRGLPLFHPLDAGMDWNVLLGGDHATQI